MGQGYVWAPRFIQYRRDKIMCLGNKKIAGWLSIVLVGNLLMNVSQGGTKKG